MRRGLLLVAASGILGGCYEGVPGAQSDTDTTASGGQLESGAGSSGSTDPEQVGTTGTTGESGEDPGSTSNGPDASAESSTGVEDEVPDVPGVFVSVGDGGRRAHSTDGMTWIDIVGTGAVDTQEAQGQEDILRAVAAGDGVAIAVGGGGTYHDSNSMVMRTEDGVTWEEDVVGGVSDLDVFRLYDVTFTGGAFVAVGQGCHVIRSEDGGVTWMPGEVERIKAIRARAIAANDDAVVVVGYDRVDAMDVGYWNRSLDVGQTWGAHASGGAPFSDVVAGAEGFVAIGPERCSISEDGQSWSPCELPGSSAFFSIARVQDRFTVVTDDGVHHSDDGQTWSAEPMPRLGWPSAVAVGNGMFVGVRWSQRGFTPSLDAWAFSDFLEHPMRDVAFLELAR